MLSDDEIIELIHKKTYAYLSLASYSTLRQHCLEQQALSTILEQVKIHIVQLAEHEKRAYISQQMLLACARQHEQDIEENKRDTEEAEIERLQCAKLNRELTSMADELEFLRQEKNKQEELLNNLKPLINILSEQINQYKTNQSSYEHNQPPGVVRNYINNEPQNKSPAHFHEHENTNQVDGPSHLYPTLTNKAPITVLSSIPAEAQSQLILQKDLMETQYNFALEKLKDCSNKIEKLIQRIGAANHKLNYEIPQIAQARMQRQSERELREHARINKESIQAQLSPKNYTSLLKLMREFNVQKDAESEQTLEKAAKFSYKEYIFCLLNAINDKKLLLNFGEMAALEQIARYMHESLNVASEIQERQLALTTEQHVKRNGENLLSECEEELLNLQRANPMLTNQNSRFDEDNKRLTQTISERLQDRNQLLKIGAGILLLTLITALLAFIGGLELIFFTPSALCAAATLGLFVTSLIYTAQNNSDKYQFKQNQISIEMNSQKISTQTLQITTLEKTTIPELKITISDALLIIERIKQEIADLQKKRQLFISRAERVTTISNIYPTPSSSTTSELDDCLFSDSYDSKSETETDELNFRL